MSIPFTSSFLPAPTTPVDSVWTKNPPCLSQGIGAPLTQESERQADRPEAVLDEFADFIAEAHEAGAVDKAILALARKIAGPDVRDIVIVRDEGAYKPSTGEHSEASLPIEFPFRFGGQVTATLRVIFDGPQPFSPDQHRRLATLATLGAAATQQSRSAVPLARSHATRDLTTGLPNGAFLSTFLPYAMALSGRRREPLSLLTIGLDRLTALRDLHGTVIADKALQEAGQTIAGLLRTSDLIARLDDGRLVAILPGASPHSAQAVAESIRAAVAAQGRLSTVLPVLTASIGVASYPENAGDPIALRSAAAAALTVARSKGSDQVVIASPTRSPKAMTQLRIAE